MTAQMDSYKQENESTTDLIGQDWQKLLDLIERREGDHDIKSFDGGGGHQRQYKTDENVLRTLQDVKRLRQKDMPLFGHCPETDIFYTVVCSTCGMILMPHALRDHCEKRHGETVDKYGDKSSEVSKLKSKKFPPPKLDKMDKSKKLEDVKKLEKKKLKPEERPTPPQLEPMITTPKAEKPKPTKNGVSCAKFVPDLQPVVALSPIQVVETLDDKDDNLPKKSKRDKKKIDRKIDKIYDPDKHCGVINDNGKPCVRSILCKVHQVALKRAVPNRSMPYDMLTRILKTQNDEDKTKDGILVRPKMENEKPVQDTQIIEKNWTQSSDQVSIKIEEPPSKRLKIKEEEIIDEEGDQNQFVLPSHLEALIDETLKTLKDVEENEQLPVMSVAPKPEPLVKWTFEQLPHKSPSPPPHIILDDIHWHSGHPKPLATNTFGCRLIGGLMSTCKKLDTLRKHLQSVWSSSATNPTSNAAIRSSFNDIYTGNNAQNTNVTNVSKNSFPVSKYSKKPNQNKQVQLIKKNVPSPIAKGTSIKRKRKTNANIISPVQNTTSNASDIISGLLISNPVPIQRTGPASVPTIPTGVIPVNSITGNGVPLRLFQGSLPVIASTAPNQPATFIQLNLCPPK